MNVNIPILTMSDSNSTITVTDDGFVSMGGGCYGGNCKTKKPTTGGICHQRHSPLSNSHLHTYIMENNINSGGYL